MMNNYAKVKNELDRIRSEYGCKGEMIFRTSLQYIVEFGQDQFSDEEWVEEELRSIDKKHDEAEAEGKILFIGREFEKALVECAREIAKVDAYYMLVYVQKEVWLSDAGGIDYEQAVRLLKGCMSWIEEDHSSLVGTLGAFEDIGFDDDDIEALGFGYVLDVREEEE